ncbi:KH domain-containing protein HEN4-like [Iris pallida]|uniref:KH domain-containing protein HEN4-like n=1 Tax=Iris pallida TaxID=29817 RepID=A0AAX6DP72_IRIPA|nr:KH domain-containing protein HEN4-like [Iris pallida]
MFPLGCINILVKRTLLLMNLYMPVLEVYSILVIPCLHNPKDLQCILMHMVHLHHGTVYIKTNHMDTLQVVIKVTVMEMMRKQRRSFA